jgi:hypothetical protein
MTMLPDDLRNGKVGRPETACGRGFLSLLLRPADANQIFTQPAGGFLPGWMAPQFLHLRAFASA